MIEPIVPPKPPRAEKTAKYMGELLDAASKGSVTNAKLTAAQPTPDSIASNIIANIQSLSFINIHMAGVIETIDIPTIRTLLWPNSSDQSFPKVCRIPSKVKMQLLRNS